MAGQFEADYSVWEAPSGIRCQRIPSIQHLLRRPNPLKQRDALWRGLYATLLNEGTQRAVQLGCPYKELLTSTCCIRMPHPDDSRKNQQVQPEGRPAQEAEMMNSTEARSNGAIEHEGWTFNVRQIWSPESGLISVFGEVEKKPCRRDSRHESHCSEFWKLNSILGEFILQSSLPERLRASKVDGPNSSELANDVESTN